MTLVNREYMADGLSRGLPVKALLDRATGRTTALALSYLSAALKTPGVAIKVKDHATEEGRTWSQNDKYLVKRIAEIGNLLGLQKMKYDDQYCTVTSNFAEQVEL